MCKESISYKLEVIVNLGYENRSLFCKLADMNITKLLHIGEDIIHDEKKSMKELHTNLKEITYYLIQFFYKTGEKYSCTQTKLGKMLSILAFKYARNDKKLFDISIYKYPPHCGTLIKELTFIPKDIYEREFSQNNPDTADIITVGVDDSIQIPEPYNEVNNLSLEIKKDIEDLFFNFGAYPADELGKLLNPIVDQLVNQQNDELDLSRLITLDRNIINIGQDSNRIVDYIYQ